MSNSLPDELTFEQALEALEKIVRELEDGQTGLEESLQRYEMGVALLKRCYGQLCEAEQRILQLTGVDEITKQEGSSMICSVPEVIVLSE